MIQSGKRLPARYSHILFGHDAREYVERAAIYRLEYKTKDREQDILANTLAGPLQEVRSFNIDNPFEDGWQNLLIYGDNLLALRAIYEDQRGQNRLRTKDRIKLVYIEL